MNARVAIENVNQPGRTQLVDGAKYAAMRKAMLDTLSAAPGGLTFDDLVDRLAATSTSRMFPGGAQIGWYAKAVQLDLEAKKVIARTRERPMRLRITQ